MNVLRGKVSVAPRRVIYGASGVGKSTFACAEPGVLALDYENGLNHIGVDRVEGAPDWEASLSLLREACTGPGSYTGVVIDTIDRLEDQAAQFICKVQGIDGKKKASLADYGYGDGYAALETKWRELLFVLEGARAKGRSVTLVAHVQSSTEKDPTMGDYRKYIAAIHKKCWSVTHRWADAVLFATYESGLVEGRAIMTGQRMLHTVAGSGFDAKHRPNIASPLPLSWEAYAAAVAASSRSAQELLDSIRGMIIVSGSAEMQKKAEEYIEKANGDVLQLARVEANLRKKVHEASA
jgi:hypothetical protein